MGMSLMEGNEAIAWGALDAGCKFFAGYPITPATSVYNNMLRLLPPQGGVRTTRRGRDRPPWAFCLGASHGPVSKP